MSARNDENMVRWECSEVQQQSITTAWGLAQESEVTTGSGYTHTRYRSASGTVVEFIDHDYRRQP